MRRVKLQPLLLFVQKVMDLLQNSSEESWIRVFYITDNFVTFSCATEKGEKETGNRWSNFELFCHHGLIGFTMKHQQDTRLWCWSKRKSQRCEARWVLKMHLEAHFDFSATDKISDLCSSFPQPQLRSLANTLRTCQSIWTCQTVFLTFLKSVWLDLELSVFADFQVSSNLKRSLSSQKYPPVSCLLWTWWQFTPAVTQNQDSSFSSVQGPGRANTAFIHLFLKVNS